MQKTQRTGAICTEVKGTTRAIHCSKACRGVTNEDLTFWGQDAPHVHPSVPSTLSNPLPPPSTHKSAMGQVSQRSNQIAESANLTEALIGPCLVQRNWTPGAHTTE